MTPPLRIAAHSVNILTVFFYFSEETEMFFLKFPYKENNLFFYSPVELQQWQQQQPSRAFRVYIWTTTPAMLARHKYPTTYFCFVFFWN